MAASTSCRRAITLQCGVFRETTIFEEQALSVFLELVYFFLDNKVFIDNRVSVVRQRRLCRIFVDCHLLVMINNIEGGCFTNHNAVCLLRMV